MQKNQIQSTFKKFVPVHDFQLTMPGSNGDCVDEKDYRFMDLNNMSGSIGGSRILTDMGERC